VAQHGKGEGRSRRSGPPPARWARFDLRASTWLDVAMTRVKIAELKDHLSEHLRAVEAGGEIEVMDRNRPIARIAPIRKDGPRIRLLPAKRRLSRADREPQPSADWPVGSLELLLEERRDR